MTSVPFGNSDEYTAAVNCAVAEGRFDVVERLADEYPDAALGVMIGI